MLVYIQNINCAETALLELFIMINVKIRMIIFERWN